MLRGKIKRFIENHKDLIQNNNWEDFYTKARSLNEEVLGELDYLLEEAGIHPLEYLTSVPSCYLYSTPIKNINIPEGIETIGSKAFKYCKLTSIFIPDSVSNIQMSAFRSCSNLNKIELGKNLRIIDEYAFWGCTNIESITFPNKIHYIGNSSFYDCKNLSKLQFEGSTEEWAKITKKSNWCDHTEITKVICTDGEVEIKHW